MLWRRKMTCNSTHGGAGYPIGTIITEEGKAICPICGVEMVINEGAIGNHVIDKRNVK
jgi:ssDNA-binding Zn-finger/Zn-ribbon topoisomerase 1